MGNKDSKSQASIYTTKYDYFEEDIVKLQRSFDSLADESKHFISESSLKKLFPENPDLGSLFYKWMSSHSTNGKIDFETYLGSMELIVKSPSNYNLSKYSKITFEKYQILFTIVNPECVLGKNEQVTSAQVTKFFTYVINAFNKSPSDGAGKAATSATLGIFDENESISWSDFVYSIRKYFPQINTVVRTYFFGKLMDSSVSPKLPAMSEKSALLTSDYLALLFMSNPRYSKNEHADLLYTTAKTGTSFNRLMFSIQGYEGPTYFLIEHYDSGESNYGIKKGDSYIFGGFTNTTWNEQLGYQGDSDGFLYSLSPKYRPFFTQKGEKGKNYIYLNSRKIQNSKYKPGLGFGGEDFKNYRIWIDDEIESESYATAEDNTYETGYLVHPSIRKFNIHTIEIWGTGGRKGLEKQNDFRESESKITEGQRKVDRKAFLSSGFDKEMFFSKTYAAANNRDDQTDFKAEMQKQEDMEKHKK